MRRTILVLLIVLFSMSLAWGQSVGPVKVIYPKRIGLSPPLRDIPPVPEYNGLEPRVIPNRPSIYEGQGSGASRLDPVLQSSEGPRTFGPTIQNFDGVTTGSNPPDTNGEVGLNHFVQTVNTQYSIWNKTGTQLLGPLPLNTVFTGFGGPCEFTNRGDPITLYDQLADRWVLSQFTAPGAPSATQCFAVSTSGDPTGSYFLYEFPTPGNDYPKLSVWDDLGGSQSSYLAGIRNFAGAFQFDAYAVERDVMLSGGANPALVVFNLSALVPGANNFLPSDIEGLTPAPAGTPPVFLGMDNPSVPQDELEMLELEVDWNTPANSTLTRLPDVPVAEFDANVCFFIRNCIPQPNTNIGLDGFADAMMFRLPYRNFGGHQSLVCTHTVDVGDFPDHAGIRWHELQNAGATNGAWTLHQESTYSPDLDHRWMPSISINANGDIMVGYSVSSNSTFPGIRYSGRQGGDPLNLLTFAEGRIIDGRGPQVSSNRWGDYTDMTVDPSDDVTFWYTNQYQAQGGGPKNTRIASMQATTANPNINITVTPINPPIVIPPGGGEFRFDITIQNFSNTQIDHNVWAFLTDPFATTTTVKGPFTMSMDPGQVSSFSNVAQVVPGASPSGPYTFGFNSGTHPTNITSSDNFMFTKSAGPIAKSSEIVTGWYNGFDPNNPDEKVIAAQVPEGFVLDQNYPNPFNPSTSIQYGLDKDTQVKLTIYNMLGQEVRTLVDGFQSAGPKSVSWDGKDALGQPVSAGVYLYKLQAGNQILSKKMAFTK